MGQPGLALKLICFKGSEMELYETERRKKPKMKQTSLIRMKRPIETL
uniref:Uncharacterized protein n=1 Tax=Rhizophora mucronata TaxID=61149 RepID=A0A2P2QVY9_RHIMU